MAAVRFVHEQLQSLEGSDAVALDRYLKDLLGQFTSSIVGGRMAVELDLQPVRIDGKRAVPVGILVNEIATNAIKHAFVDGDSGSLSVTLADVDGDIALEIANSGPPFPGDVDLDSPETLGLQLVVGLIDQLGGSLDLVRSPHPVFSIRFPRDAGA